MTAFQQVRLQSDSGLSRLASITLTLGSGGSETTVEIPAWVNGFRVYATGNIKFAVNQTPTDATSSDAAVQEEDLGVGGYVKATMWEVRILALTPGRILHLRAGAGGETVNLEFF